MNTLQQSLLLAAFFSVASSVVAAECLPLQEARGLIAQQQWAAIESRLAPAQAQCHSGERVALSVLAAKTCYQALATGPERSGEDFHTEIQRCSGLGPAWEVQFALCKSQAQRRERGAAAQACAVALEQINDRSATPVAQEQKEVEVASLLAEQVAVGSADGFPEIATRGNEPGGVMALITRGMGVRPWPAPLHFVTGSDVLTASGEVAFKALFAALKARCSAAPATIKLEGYADPRGSLELNQALSRQRAATMQKRMQREGLSCPVLSEGRGVFPTANLDPNNVGQYSQQERWQLMRSVRLSATPKR